MKEAVGGGAEGSSGGEGLKKTVVRDEGSNVG